MENLNRPYIYRIASATDNAIVRFDGTTGKKIQDSGASVDDAGMVTSVGLVSTGIISGIAIHSSGAITAGGLATVAGVASSANVSGSTIHSAGTVIGGGVGTFAGVASSAAVSGATIHSTGVITSAVASGTAPFTITSITPVSNLNADKFDSADLDTDTSLAANSDAKVPSQKAVKTYVDVAYRSIVLTAQGGVPATTNGCAAAAQTEATNGQNYYTLDFDTGSDEYACWTFVMPDNYNGSTVTAQYFWTASAGTLTNTVNFAGQGRAYADSDAIDQAWGDPVGVSDALITLGDVHISVVSAAITFAGSPAGGQLVMFRVYRDVSEDNIENDVKLIAVKLEYGTSAFSD